MDAGYKKVKSAKIKIIIIVLSIFVIAVAAFFAVFWVNNVEVEGNTVYTDEEIKEICMDNPLSINSVLFSALESRIDLRDEQFLDHVNVQYVNHDTIRLTVVETLLVGVLEVDGIYYYFDQSGKVTETFTELKEEEKGRVPLIYGLGASNIGLGHTIKFENENVLNTIVALRRMIDKYNICPESISFDYALNITLKYGDVNIELGKDELLEEKMTRVAAILPKVTKYGGTLHLENFSNETENIVFDIGV